MFQRTLFKTSVSLKYDFHGEVDQPKWVFHWPGSYAPGWEHTADELLPVVSVSMTMLRLGPVEPWEVKDILIECSGTNRGPGNVITITSADQAQPRWLTDLITRAKTAVCHY